MFSIMDVCIEVVSEISKSLNLMLVAKLLRSDLGTGYQQETWDVDVQ